MVLLDHDEELEALAWEVRLDGSRIRGPAHHQEGGADGIPLPSKKKVIGPIKVHVDNEGIIYGLWRGERKLH